MPAVTVAVRTGDHPGFGRVVVDLGRGMKHELARQDERVTVKLEGAAGPVAPSAGARPPRNVTAIATREGQLELTLAAGARMRSYRLGDRLVLDIADRDPSGSPSGRPDTEAAPARPPAAKPQVALAPAAAQRASPSGSTLSMPRPPSEAASQPDLVLVPIRTPPRRPATAGAFDRTRAGSPDARHRGRAEAGASAHNSPAAGQGLEISPAPLELVEVVRAAPLGLSAMVLPGEAGGSGPASSAAIPSHGVTLPFGPTSGAAALRRGDTALVVFDERRPVDLSALRADAVFGAATITLLPGATVLRVPLAADQQLRLARAAAGWIVTVVPPEPHPAPLSPIRAEAHEGRLRMQAASPGQVVAVPDPITGGTLLIGTQRIEGQGFAVDRRSPEFALLPTWQGVAVLPLTDALALRPQTDNFVLAAGAGRPLALSATASQTLAMTEAATASRRFDLPALPLEALHRRLQSARMAAASAAPQARTARRREVIEAQLALGMGQEMLAVATAITSEDARAAEDSDLTALSAIAALLAGRIDESAAIDDASLDGTDEIAFWRAVRAAQLQPGTPRAAALFGSAMPLLLSYPAPLRERLLPLVLETMAQGGEASAAKSVLERLAEQPGLDLARAMATERTGDPAGALALYDRVANGTDRRARAQAARQAVELRLAAGSLTPAKAADALERLVFAWRGDGVEIATRLRVAELRAQAGAWRTSLALLREMLALFPEQGEAARRALADVFARSLAPAAQDKLSPLDFVALAEENADLLPGGPSGHALAVRLADRLMALDLPARARPVLEKLADQAPPGIARATLGGTLAGLRLEQGSAEDALAALSASVVEGSLPPELLEQRTLVFARAAASTGDVRTAVGALAELGTPAALALRATLLEQAKDWPAASAALSALARASLPPTGMLDATQSRLVLRMAAAAAQAGDERALAGLRANLAPRLGQEQMRDLANLLSAAPVQGVGDLPRAAQEARLARSVPASFRALAAAAP